MKINYPDNEGNVPEHPGAGSEVGKRGKRGRFPGMMSSGRLAIDEFREERDTTGRPDEAEAITQIGKKEMPSLRQVFISPSMTSRAWRPFALIVPPEMRRLVTQARRHAE